MALTESDVESEIRQAIPDPGLSVRSALWKERKH